MEARTGLLLERTQPVDKYDAACLQTSLAALEECCRVYLIPPRQTLRVSPGMYFTAPGLTLPCPICPTLSEKTVSDPTSTDSNKLLSC